tara:strand:+ start:162 stop:524 length:363 start_codon:yes stop_codon:yes gene_type:complete
MKSVKESIDEYKESGAIIRCEDADGCAGHISISGSRIEYNDYNVKQFHHSLGDEVVKIDGEDMTGEAVGFLNIEVFDKDFVMTIETAHTTIVEITDLDNRILKRLAKFLSYAVADDKEIK